MKHLAKLGALRLSAATKSDCKFALWFVGIIAAAFGLLVLSTLVSGQWLLTRF